MRPRINHTVGAAGLLGIIEHAHLRTDKPNIGGWALPLPPGHGLLGLLWGVQLKSNR